MTNILALAGYAAYPLMPPRLLPDCATPYGGCDPGFRFVDTLDEYSGFGSWRSAGMSKVCARATARKTPP